MYLYHSPPLPPFYPTYPELVPLQGPPELAAFLRHSPCLIIPNDPVLCAPPTLAFSSSILARAHLHPHCERFPSTSNSTTTTYRPRILPLWLPESMAKLWNRRWNTRRNTTKKWKLAWTF